MNKQVEEMRKDLIKAEWWTLNEESGSFDYNHQVTAENLYCMGYRKASTVARAIFAEIDKTAYGDMDFFKMLKKKYESEGADDETQAD